MKVLTISSGPCTFFFQSAFITTISTLFENSIVLTGFHIVHYAFSIRGDVNIRVHSSGFNFRFATRYPLNGSSLICLSFVRISWCDVRFVFRKNESVIKNFKNKRKSREFFSFGKSVHQTFSCFPFK